MAEMARTTLCMACISLVIRSPKESRQPKGIECHPLIGTPAHHYLSIHMMHFQIISGQTGASADYPAHAFRAILSSQVTYPPRAQQRPKILLAGPTQKTDSVTSPCEERKAGLRSSCDRKQRHIGGDPSIFTRRAKREGSLVGHSFLAQWPSSVEEQYNKMTCF
ncbi:hypothetical protein N7501_009612 [Penicillium viridicatum]|nr:hypothetical protein N7501_009612 [Penicillium viridicatum]